MQDNRRALMYAHDDYHDTYWSNLYAACELKGEVSYTDFRQNPWAWLNAFGAGRVGGEFLPLLPRQRHIRRRIDARTTHTGVRSVTPVMVRVTRARSRDRTPAQPNTGSRESTRNVDSPVG